MKKRVQVQVAVVVTHDEESGKNQIHLSYPKEQGVLSTRSSASLLMQGVVLCIRTFKNTSTTDLTLNDLRDQMMMEMDGLLKSGSFGNGYLQHIDTKKS